MSSRLIHSERAEKRAMDISSSELFVYVEGGLDRTFSDIVIDEWSRKCGVRYTAKSVKEVTGTGGKPSLLALFARYKKKGQLNYVAFGKPIKCLFLLDKDCDDYYRRMKRSSHILYTNTYDLEGHLACSVNFFAAYATACHSTPGHVKACIGDFRSWIGDKVLLWKEWIALCMVSGKWRVNTGATFDRVSAVNVPPLALSDPVMVSWFLSGIAVAAGKSEEATKRDFDRAIAAVSMSVMENEPLRYFKGKWLSNVFASAAESFPRLEDARNSCGHDTLMSALLSHSYADVNAKKLLVQRLDELMA